MGLSTFVAVLKHIHAVQKITNTSNSSSYELSYLSIYKKTLVNHIKVLSSIIFCEIIHKSEISDTLHIYS